MVWTYPKIIAHRGGGILAPENTLLAMQTGLAHGFKAVEFDVMLSKDNLPMVMHDHILGRTTRSPRYTGKETWFSDVDSSVLSTIDAGSWFDPSLTNVTIPSFESVIQYCKTNNIWMNIEIKPVPGYEVITGRTVAELTSSHFPLNNANCPLFSSFSFEALMEAKKSSPHIPRGFLVDSFEDEPFWRERLEQLEAVSFHVNYKILSKEVIDEVKSLGYGLFCYTINDEATAQDLLSRGVDSFCTDRLDIFRGGELPK